jgi:hypothetical protein
MEILVKDVLEGKCDNEIVWICDYRQPNFSNKPLRKISPIKCKIISNEQLPVNKRIFYSKSHFIPLNKNGLLSKKIILPFDNTGFRARVGNVVHVFDNEKDCIIKWNNLIDEHVAKLKHYVTNQVLILQGAVVNMENLKCN